MGKGDRAGPHVVYSKVLGLQPCEVVGRNAERVLIRIAGLDRPLSMARGDVFAIADGYALEDGEIVQLDPTSPPPGARHGEDGVGDRTGGPAGASTA